VLTGETGAGKSILLDSLGLALGARADSGLVRDGQAQAVVTVSFELPPRHPAQSLLAENGLESDPGEPLVIRRIVKADGGSRALVNDQSASVALLRDLGAMLVEIHGQHDDRGLLNPRGHRALLDTYGGLDTEAVSRAYRAVQEAKSALASARAEQDAAERDREWLEHAVAELQTLAPEAGEEESLASLRATMQTGQRLSSELATIGEQLEGSDGALALLRQAARRLDRMASEHELLAEALAAVDRAVIEASDAEDKLARAVDELAFEPARLDEGRGRVCRLRAAARKHPRLPGRAGRHCWTISPARLDLAQSGRGTHRLSRGRARVLPRNGLRAAAAALSAVAGCGPNAWTKAVRPSFAR
jgi:DNA repair protein RecN (Recombination protein N)